MRRREEERRGKERTEERRRGGEEEHLGPAHLALPPASNGPNKELRTCMDWTENALNGDHLWMETSCSGDLCYLGEDTCLLKAAINFRCKPTYREGGSRCMRDVIRVKLTDSLAYSSNDHQKHPPEEQFSS
ncbi:Diacylglycerol kinase iota [Liparis tanakae]|uniref:Diacylglycerol kinase iota n=1 Tax=Liparis tanakae TaxID=230148 RepID=A0A4Z2IFW5_9TELE|nr:Diacylglycerol kinase iota [Liparis tanakae]